MVRINGFDYKKSTRKDKKLMVKTPSGKLIHFGNPKYQHFKDRTKIWSKLDHNNTTRQNSYLSRSKGIKNKKGELTWTNPESANYHAIRILWM